LPSGALLVVTVAAAASLVMAAGPAVAGPVTPAARADSRTAGGGQTGTTAGDKIRRSEWWLSRLQVTQAWQSSRGAGVTVALLSTGVLTSHPDLAGSVTTGPDFTGSGETSASTTWGIEGTSAASIIAGHGDNTGDASGLIGIAPQAKILSIRVAFDAADGLNASSSAVGRLPGAIADGIRYAADHGAKVIDLPLDPATLASDGAATGGLAAAEGGSAAERSAVSYALGKGAVLIAPAGDNGEDGNTSSFPAAYPGVIAVGAVDKHSSRAGFSTRQSYVATTAPGVGVTTASRPSGYRTMSTTDAASAMAAGVTALIRSRYPTLSNTQVRQALLKGSAAPPAAGATGDGAGTLDALKAVQAAAAIASPTPTARPSTPVATAPATVRPLTAPARPGTVGMARSALRDAAAAAGGLIVLLLGILLGLRLWRRRTEQETRSAPEPRTLLNAPSGPPSGPLPIQATNARHARAMAAEPAFTPTWTPDPRPAPGAPLAPAPRPAEPVRVPDSVSPRFAPPGAEPVEPDDLDEADDDAVDGPAPAGRGRGRARDRSRGGRSGTGGRISGHGLRARTTPASRTATHSPVESPGSPPWAPAPAPDHGLAEPPRPADAYRPPAPTGPVIGRPRDPAGPEFPVTGPSWAPAGSEPPATGSSWDPAESEALPQRDPGPSWADQAPPPPATPSPAAPPTAGWRPVPPTGVPLPRVPAPPSPASPPPAAPPVPPPATPASPGGFMSSGGSAFGAGFDPADDPILRPISPRDRLPLEPDPPSHPSPPSYPGPPRYPGPSDGPQDHPGPAGPSSPAPQSPAPWRIPGSSGRFPGAGEDPTPTDWPDDAYPGRTGRLGRQGEFLPPYAGRPSPADEPEPGPAPEGPQPPRGRGTTAPRPGDSPSGPLYIWNPAALTEPFPETEPEGDDPQRPS
jgi:hypothetical protein